jgi:hypothetical protein
LAAAAPFDFFAGVTAPSAFFAVAARLVAGFLALSLVLAFPVPRGSLGM